MSSQQNYQTLVADYNKGVQFVKKLGLAGGMMQFSIFLIVNSWKHVGIPYYKFGAPLLFSWAVYSFTKDFVSFLNIEKNMSRVIRDGIQLEKQSTSLGDFFHEVLQNFHFVRILVQRSLLNLAAIGCFGYLLSQILAELSPTVLISYERIAWITAVLTAFTCTIYYNALKSLAQVKAQIFVTKH